jgi:hypothetical protein
MSKIELPTSTATRFRSFAAGPSIHEVEQRAARFAALESADETKAPQIETGTWSPRTGDELRGFFLGIATLGRNPRPEEVDQVKLMKENIEAGDEETIGGLTPAYIDEYRKGLVPFSAGAIETKNGLRFLSRIHAMEVFASGRIPQNGGVWIKCIHEKSGEMSKFDIRAIDSGGDVEDTTYTEE